MTSPTLNASCGLLSLLLFASSAAGTDQVLTSVEGQPLAANVLRLLDAFDYLGTSLPGPTVKALRGAARRRDVVALQQQLDPHVLLVVSLNPESRVKVTRGAGAAELQQGGFRPVLVKILNDSTVTQPLRIVSPQAGAVYAGVSRLSMQRQQQEHLGEDQNVKDATDRFLALEMFTSPPMTDRLSGLEVEYAIALIYSSESGRREATIGFDVGQGTEDLGFRGEVPVLFEVRPEIPVKLNIRDTDGQPTTARLLFRNRLGHVYPLQPKRLAPDFFFQPHIYREDGEVVGLPPGPIELEATRGPEYRRRQYRFTVPDRDPFELDIRLERWIDPGDYGFFSGDHHIHAAGCAHYTIPTQGVTPRDMFRQIKGEALNVGCVLTWGPCFSHQRQFFAPQAHEISQRWHVLKYDLEISGFGSQALGHVCLLNLKDQTYPGSNGTATQGWPTWTTPVMRWAKQQGGITGYAHSASGLQVDPPAAAQRLLAAGDADRDGYLDRAEAAKCMLPETFDEIDHDGDDRLRRTELQTSLNRVSDQLPNLAIPEMNGVGAMEICVSVAEGVCDFISAMDTERIQEWNMWYHLLNCGFPLKVSGETDFPCMSSRRIGQGRVYVQLGRPDRVDFETWCRGLAAGRSYVSDGFAHALQFAVNGTPPGGDDLVLAEPGRVHVRAEVAFSAETPTAVAYGTLDAPPGPRVLGDTRVLHGERLEQYQQGGQRKLELIVNGLPVASKIVPADGQVHAWECKVDVAQSSWIALRHFPQLHTNPVRVIVGQRPIRVSRKSALWCIETIELLWRNRRNRIASHERPAARAAFDRAIERYRTIAASSP